MAIDPISGPPVRIPITEANGTLNKRWEKFHDAVWRKLGGITNNAPISSATVQLLTGQVPPEGVQTADPGTFYVDNNASVVYLKVSGNGSTGWITT